MPTNGLFSRVLKGGTIQLNDSVEVLKEKDKRLRVAILTLSDKGSQGLREDLSGPYIQDYFKERGYYVTSYEILPDEQALIEQALINLSDRCHNDFDYYHWWNRIKYARCYSRSHTKSSNTKCTGY